MCKLLDTKRLDYYLDVRYDGKPLYKEGDIVWVYETPPGTGVWLIYEAKIVKLRAHPEEYKSGSYLPVYEVDYYWQHASQPYCPSFYEIHLYDPKQLTAEEMLFIIGKNNQTVLANMPDAKRRKVPKQGLVFLGHSQLEKIRNEIVRFGGMTYENHAEFCDSSDSDDSDAETNEKRRRNRGRKPFKKAQ